MSSEQEPQFPNSVAPPMPSPSFVNEEKIRNDAEALLRAVARAFYDDTVVVVVDYLITVRFLRQDGKGRLQAAPKHAPLQLPNKQLRKTLACLQQEHIAFKENVTGLLETKDRRYRREKSAEFWYIDYNRAIHSLRLRLHVLKSHLTDTIVRLSSHSTYSCPSCGDLSNELEVQTYPTVQDAWQCISCWQTHEHNPNRPDIQLQLVDCSGELRTAEMTLQRFNAQMNAASMPHARPGIYDMLKSLRRHVIPSNLPSENGAAEYVGMACNNSKDHATTGGIDGERNERLLLVPGDSRQAHMLATGIAPAVSGPRFEAVVLASEAKKREPETTPSNLLQQLEKPKAVCRQTTPYFLKNDTISTFVEEGECAMRSLSLQTLDDEEMNNGITCIVDEQSSDGLSSSDFLHHFQDEKQRQEALLESVFRSTDTYTSVNWEDA